MHAERVRKRDVGQIVRRREGFLEQRDVLDAFDREGADLVVLGHVGEEIQTALRVGETVWMDNVVLAAPARARVITENRLTVMKRGFERFPDNLLLSEVAQTAAS